MFGGLTFSESYNQYLYGMKMWKNFTNGGISDISGEVETKLVIDRI